MDVGSDPFFIIDGLSDLSKKQKLASCLDYSSFLTCIDEKLLLYRYTQRIEQTKAVANYSLYVNFDSISLKFPCNL